MKGGLVNIRGKKVHFFDDLFGDRNQHFKKTERFWPFFICIGFAQQRKNFKEKISLCTDNIFPFLRNAVQKEN